MHVSYLAIQEKRYVHGRQACVDEFRPIVKLRNHVPLRTKEKIDLVLMGTQGESNASNRVFGSETARIISQGKCPVLAVPKEAKAELDRVR